MVEVVNENPGTVDVSKVSNGLYYGILRKNDYSKGFITSSLYRGVYSPRCFDMLTVGNGFTSFESKNLQEVITGLLNSNFKVYQFNTYKELLKWGAEWNKLLLIYKNG